MNENSVLIYLNKQQRCRLHKLYLYKEIIDKMTHDDTYRYLNEYYNLHINFQDICNLSIDYAKDGHLTLTLTKDDILITIPEVIDLYQYHVLNDLTIIPSNINLYIYSFENDQLKTYYKDDSSLDNEKILEKVLKKKKV